MRLHAANAVLLGLLLAGIACTRTPPASPADGVDAVQLAAFQSAHAAWARAYDASLAAPEGYPALVGLHWVEEGAHHVGSSPRNGMRLALGPPHLGLLERRDGRLRFVPERGVAVTLDGVALRGAVALRDDRHADGPTTLGFDAGQGAAWVIRRGDRLALRVRHAQAPARASFKGAAFWPVPEKLKPTTPTTDCTSGCFMK